MAEDHKVAQGEHLTSIAAQYGFTDYTVVWNDANNAQSKAQRINPNVLLEGDNVCVPDKESKTESGSTNARHSFQVKATKLMLRIVLEDIYEKPIANSPATLSLDGAEPIQVRTDGKGKLQQEIAHNLKQCMLTPLSDQIPFAQAGLSLRIGELDPMDAISGQYARLNNLGYAPGVTADANAPSFLSAVGVSMRTWPYRRWRGGSQDEGQAGADPRLLNSTW